MINSVASIQFDDLWLILKETNSAFWQSVEVSMNNHQYGINDN